MNESRDEKILRDYLAGESPLSKRYASLGNEQPPTELDEKILAAASESSKVVPLERAGRRWGAALAVAATVLLCVSVVVNLSIQPEGPLLGEPPPMAEFAEESAFADQDFAAGREPEGRLDSLRRQARPAQAPARERPAPMASADSEQKLAAPAGLPPMDDPGLADADTLQLQRPDSGEVDLGRAGQAGLQSPPSAAAVANIASAAKLPRDDQLLQRAISFLNEPPGAADRPARKAEFAQPSDEISSQGLAQIQAAYQANDLDLAWSRLQAFRADYPQHPLSVFLRDAAGAEADN
jgi:hypothetical protein